MVTRDYFHDLIIAAHVCVPRGERVRDEVDRVLEAVNEASSTFIWPFLSDATDEAMDYFLDRALSIGVESHAVPTLYVSIIEHPEVRIVNYDGTTSDDSRYWNFGCFKPSPDESR